MTPEWIDSEAWNGFMEMRKTIKKPMTSRAVSMLVHRLEQLKQKGHDVNACLDQSTLHCWQDVYPLKDAEIPNLRRTYTNGRTDEMTDAERVASDEARKQAMGRLRPRLVRAA